MTEIKLAESRNKTKKIIYQIINRVYFSIIKNLNTERRLYGLTYFFGQNFIFYKIKFN